MKKIIVLAFLFLPFFASAQSECVLGLVNDPAPGSCGGYVDKDGNDLCDLSEINVSDNKSTLEKNEQVQISEEELKKYNVRQVAEVYGVSVDAYVQELSKFLKIDVSGESSLQALHDENGLCTGVAGAIAVSLQSGEGGVADLDPENLISGAEIKQKKISEVAAIYNISAEELAGVIAKDLGIKVKSSDLIQTLHDNYGLEANKVKELAGVLAEKPASKDDQELLPKPVVQEARYQLVLIVLVLMLLYLLTYVLALKKLISILSLRRIWNGLLLIAFLGSVILGLMLIIRINYGLYITLPFNMLYWHVEFSTAMAIISLIHLSWYWRFYASMFRRKN